MFYLFLAEGFEETEALATLDVMRRARLNVQTVGVTGVYVTGSHGVTVKPDVDLSDITFDGLEGVVLPGGMPGTINLGSNEQVLECVRYCFENKKITGALCTGAHVETDEHVITSKGAGCAIEFGHAIVALALGKADADRVIEEMQCL